MANESNVFLSPRLVGKRFEQHGLPLDILKDFSVLDEMVKSVAKSLYKSEHPERQRIPRNFLDDISLQIVGLEEGSTVAKIALVCLSASAGLWPTPAQEYADRARDKIISAIEDASRGNTSSPASLTQAQLMMFDRFGCSLRDGESIVFPMAGTDRNVEFTKDVRRALVSRASLNGYQETVDVYGTVPEVDQDKKSFMLNTTGGQRLQVKKYEDDQAEDIIAATAEYSRQRKVLIRGTGRYSASGQLESIEVVDDITLLDVIDFGYQLAEIESLPPGWMDGHGEVFDKGQLRKLGNLFRENYILEKDPWLYPAQDNLLLAEWEQGDWRLSMEIDLPTLKGDFYAVNIKNDQDFSQVFDLQQADQWKTLCAILEKPEEGLQG